MQNNAVNTTRAVGLVGAGYIAHYHARALRQLPGVRLACVCDVSRARAAALAAAYQVGTVYDSLNDMLANESLDVVHVLTPPEHHAEAAREVLEAGAHLFLEKPMCIDAADCGDLLQAAESRGLRVGVNHNFLFHPAYEQLRGDIRDGKVGPIDHVAITWALELPQLKAGPFDMWALQDPTNILLEIGAHAAAFVLDLALVPEHISVQPGNPVTLPGNGSFYRRWQISMSSGSSAVDIYFSFAPGFPQRSLQVSGTLGTAVADLERNTYLLQRNGRYAQDVGKYELINAGGKSLRRQARGNLARYALSKFGLSRLGNSYAASMAASIRAYYQGLGGGALDARCSGQLGRQVVELCVRLASASDVHRLAPVRPARPRQAAEAADVLILGGTGFIGRELVRQCLQAGQSVRILSRSRTLPFNPGESRLQVVCGDMRNESDIAAALRGVKGVYHLARSAGGNWQDYYEQDVVGTERLALRCLDEGVQRLVYTSSIVGYNLADRRPITEQTRFDQAICRQNKYARAKAETERRLMDLHCSRGLPVVIARPGMVIGLGGDICHAGVGTWNGLGSCVLWGDGRGKLPLVLVEDVARGLFAAMQTPGIEGESFNLVDQPCLSALDYVGEIERFAGIRIQTFPTAMARFYLADLAKWMAKAALRMPDRYVPRYRMWKGRMALAWFDCSKARQLLGWTPASDRDALVKRGIHVHLVDYLPSKSVDARVGGPVPGNLAFG